MLCRNCPVEKKCLRPDKYSCCFGEWRNEYCDGHSCQLWNECETAWLAGNSVAILQEYAHSKCLRCYALKECRKMPGVGCCVGHWSITCQEKSFGCPIKDKCRVFTIAGGYEAGEAVLLRREDDA